MKCIRGAFCAEDPHSETITHGRLMKTLEDFWTGLKMIKDESQKEHSPE